MSDKVMEFNQWGELVKEWDNAEACKESTYLVKEVCSGERKSIHKRIYKYSDDVIATGFGIYSQDMMNFALGKKLIEDKKRVYLYQFSLEGKYLRKYNNAKDAVMWASPSAISKNCRGKSRKAGNFIWRMSNDLKYQLDSPELQKELFLSTLSEFDKRPIYQYSLDDKLIKEWENFKEIDNDPNYCSGIVVRSMRKKGLTYGFKWSYEKKVKEVEEEEEKLVGPHHQSIYQYNMCGDFIKEWKGLFFVKEEWGVDTRIIGRCCRLQESSVYNFMWRYNFVEHDQILEEMFLIDNKGAIEQFDLDNNYINIWKSAKAIEKDLGIDASNIAKCCNGKLNSAGGFIFKYAKKLVDSK